MNIEILTLHSPEDTTWREWIRCRGRNLLEVLSEILNNNPNMKFSRTITRKMLGDWKRGRTAIPLWVIQEISEQIPNTKEKILNEIETLKVSRSQEIRIPERLNEKLAEIVGRHCGDGSCNVKDSDFKISLKEDPSLIEIHVEELEELFGIKPRIEKVCKKCDEAVFRSKIFARLLIKIFDIPPGKMKTFQVKEPEIIKNAGLNFRIAFLRGLIDTDGCVIKSDKRLIISFKVVNENLAQSVFDILSKLNLKPNFSIERNGDVFSVRVGRKENVKEFFEKVGSKNLRILSKLF